MNETQSTVLNRCFGYARVSSDDQNLSLQIDAFELWFTEHNSVTKRMLPTLPPNALKTALSESDDGCRLKDRIMALSNE